MTQNINRRDFLKASLASSGLVLGGALLSGRWTKPAAALSGLPAHALASAAACTPGDFTPYFIVKTKEVQVVFLFLVPASMNGQTIGWQLSAAPSITGGTLTETPDLSGSSTVIEDSGSYLLPVYAIDINTNHFVAYSGSPSSVSLEITFTLTDSSLCSQQVMDEPFTVI